MNRFVDMGSIRYELRRAGEVVGCVWIEPVAWWIEDVPE